MARDEQQGRIRRQGAAELKADQPGPETIRDLQPGDNGLAGRPAYESPRVGH